MFCRVIGSVLTVEAREAEHADLLRDVVPRPWGSQSLELLLQLSPHQQDPVGHGLHVVLPSGTSTGIRQETLTLREQSLTHTHEAPGHVRTIPQRAAAS